MPNTLRLTRNQLKEFLPDHESIKQFESLFALVDTIAPDVVNEIYITAGIADSKAVQALSAIDRIAEALDLLSLSPDKNEALDLIRSMTNEIELSTTSPARTQEQKNQEVLTWLSM